MLDYKVIIHLFVTQFDEIFNGVHVIQKVFCQHQIVSIFIDN
jgi:hypothetical protein